MKKIKGIIDRFEDGRAVVRVGGEDLVMPKKLTLGFFEGDIVSVLITAEKKKTKNSRKKAKKLISEILKEE